MARKAQFHSLLPVSQCALGAMLGGIGLWQRSAILSRPFTEGQTLWDTTARYHVWPWPFKFAVITNMPAFLCWALVSWPISERWPNTPEGVFIAPSLLFAAVLWYAVGRWLDQQLGAVQQPAIQPKRIWVLLLVFTLSSAAGASIPLTTAYLVWGVFLWLVVGGGILTRRMTQNRPSRSQ